MLSTATDTELAPSERRYVSVLLIVAIASLALLVGFLAVLVELTP